MDNYLSKIELKQLNTTDSNKLEGKISHHEASLTLKHMKNNKSPGSSGYTPEFFKCFWGKLSHFVVRAINYAFESGELSLTQKLGIITCIPKGNKSRDLLKNWRPLSLLNTIYKIASGAIANRLKTVLNLLIDNDQTGFISGRFIGENTRLIYDISIGNYILIRTALDLLSSTEGARQQIQCCEY